MTATQDTTQPTSSPFSPPGAGKPKVSVITCAYNAAPWIAQTLESVFSQTYTDYEMIVVDDGSTDGTAEIVRRYGERVRLISQSNRGTGAARNTAIASSRGELIVNLDADDLWFASALAALVPAFDDPAVGIACTDVLLWDEKTPWNRCPRHSEYYRPPNADPATWSQLMHENYIPVVTLMIRRSLIERLGGFDESLPLANDYDMVLRAALAGAKIRCLDGVHGVYRVREGSVSRNLARMLDELVLIYEKMLATADLSPDQRRLALRAIRRRRTGYRTAGVNYLLAGQVAAARRYLWRACAYTPYDPRNLLGFVLTWIAPHAAARWASAIRERRRSLRASRVA